LPDVAFWLMPVLAILIGCNVVFRVQRGVAEARRAER
jgi:cytochrome c-type biogenesis protein CcmH/NrfF